MKKRVFSESESDPPGPGPHVEGVPEPLAGSAPGVPADEGAGDAAPEGADGVGPEPPSGLPPPLLAAPLPGAAASIIIDAPQPRPPWSATQPCKNV